MESLFEEQVRRLQQSHCQILSWAAQAEDRQTKYNITNCFDDLKFIGITRTKQNAVAAVEALHLLGFIDVRDEGNRKNIYITKYGAKALEAIVLSGTFVPEPSVFLEGR